MKPIHVHIVGAFLIFGLLGFVSCGKSPVVPCETGDGSVLLTFRTGVAGAGAEVCAEGTPASDDSVVRQLHVVILSEEEGAAGEATGRWAVEVSRTIGTGTVGIPLSDAYTFRVRAGCRKRIYLLANCHGLIGIDGRPLDFSNAAFVPGADGRSAVDGYVFCLGTGKGEYSYDPVAGIPMSSVYEVEVPESEALDNNEYEISYTLYLVRAATKFSFSFTNRTGAVSEDAAKSIRVERVRIDRIAATRMYLMPHVLRNSDDRYWVVDTDRGSVVQLGAVGVEATEKDWIDWMVDETGKKNTDLYQWLIGYEIPLSQELHDPWRYTWSKGITVAPDNKKVEAAVPLYIPESRYVIQDEADASLELQQYTISFATSQRDNVLEDKAENWYPVDYSPVQLPYLASLFRNTYVKVDVTFTGENPELELQVDVEPYWEVILEPEFGI